MSSVVLVGAVLWILLPRTDRIEDVSPGLVQSRSWASVRRSPIRGSVVALVIGLLLTLVPTSTNATDSPAPPVLPPAGRFDYQLGGVRPLPDDVTVVVRDRRAEPSGRYDICYVNGFQTQPDERRFWRDTPRRWALVLKRDGRPETDEAWGEWLLDLRTPARRTRLARIVGRWVEGCADAGFDAVEFDNLDSFSRSRGLLKPRHNRAFARLLTARTHAEGLAAAQKNWVELGPAGPDLGFDFAIAEDCGRWQECGGYRAVYGRVLDVEYTARGFRRACRGENDGFSVVRRDLALAPDGLRRWC